MMKKTKVLIFGMDGATWKLLDPWIKEGKLPWFSKIKNEWFWATLQSTLPPLTGSAWLSFQTGVNPGKHGIQDFIHYTKDKLYDLVSSHDNPYPTIWKWLEKGGKKSIVVNMPMTYPIQKGKSTVVSSLMTPPGKQYARPKSIYRKLKASGYQVDLEKMTFGIPEESMQKRDELYKQAINMAKKRAQAAQMLLQNEWDFFFLLFKSTDITQHLYWNAIQTLKLYQLLEYEVDKLINLAEKKYGKDKILIILCSDHGFHRGETISFCLYDWLKREGYLQEKAPKYYNLLRVGYKLLRQLNPSEAGNKTLKASRDRLTKKEGEDQVILTRKKAKAWPVPFGIYLNDISIRDELKHKLEKLKFRKRKVFQRVYLREEIYSGKKLENLPELILLPESRIKIEANPVQKNIWERKKGYLAGNHNADPDGILAIRTVQGLRIKRKPKYRIVDVFPAIMESLGEPIPPYCDGESFIIRNRLGKKEEAEKQKIQRKITQEIQNL